MLEFISKRRRNSFLDNIAEVFNNALSKYDNTKEIPGENILRTTTTTDFDRIEEQYMRLADEILETMPPPVKSEEEQFRIPENQLIVEIKPSSKSRFYDNYIAGMSDSPTYQYSCIDEFSRDFCCIRIGDSLPSIIAISEFNPDLSAAIRYPDIINDTFEPFNDEGALIKTAQAYQRIKPTRILQNYHPGYNSWPSNFKHSPSESHNIFLDKPATDSNILLKVMSCTSKNMFEPLFGTITLFLHKNDELIRISETFNFDATPDAIKERYPGVYLTQELISRSSTGNAAKNCLMRIPEDLQKDPDLYFVVQVHKVLSGDIDKCVAPYMPRGAIPSAPKHEESCSRLGVFRQTIGLCIVKVYDETGAVGVQGKSGINFRMYAQKVSLNDAKLLDVIKALYPKDKTAPYTTMDITDIEMRVAIMDLGRDSEVPSEWLNKLLDESSRQIIKELTVFPPLSYTLSDDIARKASVSRESSIYVYPLQLEKMAQRNLTVSIQLVEHSSADPDSSYRVLQNIYSSLTGQLTTEAFSSVFYHTTNPSLMDEFKIMLPLNLSSRHSLRFAVYHVHVKPRQVNPGFMKRLTGAVPITDEAVSLFIGEGFLPLLTPAESIIPDEDRIVPISLSKEALSMPRSESPPPPSLRMIGSSNGGSKQNSAVSVSLIKIRTRVISPFFSSCPHIQQFLNCSPVPLGVAPSSRLIRELETIGTTRTSPQENVLKDATLNLFGSIPSECSRHFIILMRQLIRILCGGRCKPDPVYGNPYNHAPSRSCAFLSMLQILGNIAPDVYKARDKGSPVSGDDFLNAYLDFIFDEEVTFAAARALRATNMDNASRLINGSPYSETYDDDERISTIENTISYVTLQVERIITDALINSGMTKALETVRMADLSSRLFMSPAKSILKSSPFKDLYLSNGDQTLLDMTTDFEQRKESRRISRVMSSVRRSFSIRLSISSDRGSTDDVIVPDNRLQSIESFETRDYSAPAQWWPYLYEVIIQQWIALLCVFQNKEPSKAAPCEVKFPFNLAVLSNANDSSKDSRVLLLDHAPFLFKMIFKSIALRIDREGKPTPVSLDNLTLDGLEALVRMLSDEAASRLSSGLSRSRRLNFSLAHFLRRLVSIIAPMQVTKLISAYFQREKTKRSEEIGLRLQVIEELGAFDYYISLSMFATLDTRLVNQSKLAHLCIEEVMFAFRQSETSLHSIRILRDILVRHSYVASQQDSVSRERIAALYVPLISEIVAEADRLSRAAFDSSERRELLAILLYLLQDVPERQLREQFRRMTLPISQFSSSTPVSGKRVSIGSTVTFELPILRLISVLHLILDTFDHPHSREMLYRGDGARAKVLVPGLSSTSKDFAPTKATDHLSKLDELLYRKKGRGEMITPRDSTNERKWAKQKNQKMSKEQSGTALNSLNEKIYAPAASKGICYEGTLIVLKTLKTILEEVPSHLQYHNDGDDRKIAFGELMTLSISLLLHGLLSNQSEMGIIAILDDTRLVIRRFGAQVFTTAAADSFQDWIRRIFGLCSYPGVVVRHQACDLFLLLFQSSFFHGSSLTLLKTTCLGVFNEVIEGILNTYGTRIDSVEKEDEYISYLRSSIVHMRDSVPTSLLDNPNASYQSDLRSLKAHIFAFMESLDLILAGNACVRRHVMHPIGNDWHGANLLDGPMTESCQIIAMKNHSDRVRATNGGSLSGSRPVSMSIQSVHSVHSQPRTSSSPKFINRRVFLKGELGEAETQVSMFTEFGAASTVKVDVDAVMELFIDISALYDPILLPRLRMRWLETLARLHDSKGNKVESAEVRWRLYLICENVRDSWEQVWAPREPLQWTFDPTSLSDTSVAFKQGKNFLQMFYATTAVPGKWWSSNSAFKEHTETCLVESSRRFASASLFHLAERGYHQLLGLYRQEGRLFDMSDAYQSIAGMFKSHLSSSFAIGLYYRVLYLGAESPPHLRGNEYIYRNANNLHLADFQKLLTAHLSELVADGTRVTVILDTNKFPDDDASEAFICLTSVKPVHRAVDSRKISAMNQLKWFQYSVPFTKEGGVHAKSIDGQWKRTTYLEVEEPFPYLACRQLVTKRTVRELTPVENAIEDINLRIDAMTVELQRNKKDGMDTNNLMRIVQGSVMAQVNGGAVEVAKVFLGDGVKTDAHFILEKTLFEFLGVADKLLEKSRRLLIVDESASHTDDGVSLRDSASVSGGPTSIEISNYKWQLEMENQFDLLVEGIRAHVKDVQLGNAMFRLLRKNRGVALAFSSDSA